MLPPINNQLSEDQINQLVAARENLPKVKQAIKTAKQAGIDVSQQEADVIELERKLNLMYKTYVQRPASLSNPSGTL